MTLTLDDAARVPSVPHRSARARSERFQGALMIGVLLFGAVQGGAALMTPAAQRRLRPAMDAPSLLSGQTAAAINYVQAHDLPADGALRAAGGVFKWGLFRSGDAQVAVGCGDWLYLMEELRPWPGAEGNMRARADTLSRVAGRLAGRGIALTVALVPDKARIESATLCGAPRSAQADARYGAFLAMLKARAVPVVDLATALAEARRRGPVFYRTDTHWNQEGAAVAAASVAEAARAGSAPQEGLYRYETRRASDETRGPGDMLRLMSLDWVPDAPIKLRPSPDLQRLEQTVVVAAPEGSGGLLDDAPGGRTALIGSSFSLNANFQGRLEEALAQPVDNFAEAGGGFAGSARSYFGSSAFAESPPKAIVWEIPERTVGQPLTAADRDLGEGR